MARNNEQFISSPLKKAQHLFEHFVLFGSTDQGISIGTEHGAAHSELMILDKGMQFFIFEQSQNHFDYYEFSTPSPVSKKKSCSLELKEFAENLVSF